MWYQAISDTTYRQKLQREEAGRKDAVFRAPRGQMAHPWHVELCLYGGSPLMSRDWPSLLPSDPVLTEMTGDWKSSQLKCTK